MKKRDIIRWIEKRRNRQILLAFSIPKTPRNIERELLIKKLNLKPFLDKGLIRPLNPAVRKGRFYALSDEVRKWLKLLRSETKNDNDWEMIGWIIASPRQRLSVLRIMDSEKRTSEEIRAKATQLNANISRTSIKGILKELNERNLIDSEILEGIRFYWLNEKGINIRQELAVIAPISPLFYPA